MAAVSAGYLASTPLLDMNHHEASARHCPEVALAMHTGLAKVVIMQASIWLPSDKCTLMLHACADGMP